ncbi:MAG TPA: methyltransferase [Candidatus Eisenbacteria bacterium]|nr:methyltransferase [Candidatus Eisenbacteria bacterium]
MPGAAAPLDLVQALWSFMLSQALHVAARLAVFDALHDGARTAGELAEVASAQEDPLRRLLRFLTSVDVLTEDDRGRFSLTARGEFFRSDHPQSLRPLAMMYASPYLWGAWGALYDAVKSGGPVFDRVHGVPFFDYLGTHQDDGAIFNAAMSSASNVDIPMVLGAYDFSAFRRIVDVGGGQGALLFAILESSPGSQGILYDAPSVIDGARDLASPGMAARCELVAGDMFQSVPAGGDAYVMKRILHDWSDAECVRILSNCRRAIARGGRLLVMDSVVKPPNQPDPAKWMDLNMLVLVTGRERTEAEFAKLFAEAGFRLTRVVPTPRLAIIEGVPV